VASLFILLISTHRLEVKIGTLQQRCSGGPAQGGSNCSGGPAQGGSKCATLAADLLLKLSLDRQ